MFNNILINHETNLLGWELSTLTIEFELINFSKFEAIRTTIKDDQGIIQFESETELLTCPLLKISTTGWIKPCTKYTVELTASSEEESIMGESQFETGLQFMGRSQSWLVGEKEVANNIFKYNLALKGRVKSSKLYIAALGVYEAYINGEKIGNEFLAPGFSDYTQGVECQVYDMLPYFTNAEGIQELTISMGDGWFKGNLGFEGGQSNNYGDTQMVSPVLKILYEDGQSEIVTVDDMWEISEGPVTDSSIYYGEDFNDNHEFVWSTCDVMKLDKYPVINRISPAVIAHEEFEPEVIITPTGNIILDFKQNLSGWVEFNSLMEKGQKVTLQHGEILQGNEFYNENLRFAKAEFNYISDGKSKIIRPHFTYFGFRYVKVTGLTIEQVKASNFKAVALYSDLKSLGSLTTDIPKVNKLWENITWGQKSNFLSIPTDCPQRDERLGWTGDAQIFSATALYNYDCYTFFQKFMRDIRNDQNKLSGKVSMYSPNLGNTAGGVAAWSDAITIVPWQVYLMQKDPTILSENYTNMVDWIEWVSNRVKESGKSDILWWGDFQFGDWLALDGKDPSIPSGLTDTDFIASVYQYVSVAIVAKTANILKDYKSANKYQNLASKIKTEIQNEYFTRSGKLAVNTQTAFALVIYFDLVPEKYLERLKYDFLRVLKEDRELLTTGFIGTKLVCPALSKIGYHEKAVQIFLNEEYPGWMYELNLGATTIWERWNSVLPDGSMNPEGMNSLNHYSYGAIMEWGYEYLLGIKPLIPGFERFSVTPGLNNRIKQVSGCYKSIYGIIELDWKIHGGNQVEIKLSVPSGSTAIVHLTDYQDGSLNNNNDLLTEKDGEIILSEGAYEITYQTNTSYQEYYSIMTPLKFVIPNKKIWEQIIKIQPSLTFIDMGENLSKFGHQSLKEIVELLPFINISEQEIKKISEIMENEEITYG